MKEQDTRFVQAAEEKCRRAVHAKHNVAAPRHAAPKLAAPRWQQQCYLETQAARRMLAALPRPA